MILFLFGIALLIAGYYVYGAFIEKVLGPDDREVPARAKYDAVDFVELPHWKNMLIQLLNIAGIGPVIGVILGIKFGSVVFLIIPFGNILGGAVHDFLAGMMSLRGDGCNLPTIVRRELGQYLYSAFLIFVVVLLLLVVTVFINVPAALIDGFAPNYQIFWWAVGAIFVYYIFATLFPIDQIIGRIYPLFGMFLLVGTGAIFLALLWHGNNNPYFLAETDAFKKGMLHEPIIPCLFVTIACGIMSGFHATQSPIVARTLQSERQARSTFYGMMIVEGIIAMIWAAAGLAIYNLR
ncbi:MAG: carbon starvation CstA family protein, partial [Thermoguttaceae bacterium]|nr:carbon starvation CstA family protein [Thermoguttaceae bacterium]